MKKNTFDSNNKFSYKIELDVNKDAWNWYDVCTGQGNHGMDWRKSVPVDVLTAVKDKPKSEVYEFLIPYLKQKYIDEKTKIDAAIKFFNQSYDNNFSNACKKLEEVIGEPIYRNDFTIYLTTFPRAPYNYRDGYLYTCIDWIHPMRVFLHELSHFQFIHYWRNNPESAVSELSNAEFEWLKESLTIILDKDFLPIIERVDNGYELHEKYRKELSKFWNSSHKFDELVNFGISILPKYKNEIESSNQISTYEKISSPADLQEFMSRNICYGFVSSDGRKYFYGDSDWDKDWYDKCIVQSGDEILKTKCGTCWDQVELERKWLTEHNYKFKTFFIWFNLQEPNNYPTHTFLAFNENNKWYWFENAFFDHRGIHEYNSVDELINNVIAKHLQASIESGVAKPADIKLIKKYDYNQPKPNLGVDEYIKHVTNNEI